MARHNLQDALDESDIGDVKAQIKALSAAEAHRLAETSEAVEAVLQSPPSARDDEESPMIVPVEWLQTVLYICVRSWGRPTKIRATAIYKHGGASIRTAGITALQTTQIAIHPGRYDPGRGVKTKTEYEPNAVAMEATVAWLTWEGRRQSTGRSQGQHAIEHSIDWSRAEVPDEVPGGLTVDAFVDLLQAIAQALQPETSPGTSDEIIDQVGVNESWSGSCSVGDIYDIMECRHADAVKEEGGILNIDTTLFTAQKQLGPPLLTLSAKARQWVIDGVIDAKARDGRDGRDGDDERNEDDEPRTLFKKLQHVENGGPQPAGRAPGRGSRGQAEGGTATEKTPAKDSYCGSEEADNRPLKRSDRSSHTFAVGRKSGVTSLIKDRGIRFEGQWIICRSQAMMIEAATRGLSDAAHHFFVHAVRSSSAMQKRSGGWFPFCYKHIRQTLPVSESERNQTAKVWRPLVDRKYIAYRKHHSGQGRARAFRVDPEWLTRFHEVQFDVQFDAQSGASDEHSSDEHGEITVDAFTGQCKPQRPQRTRCHDRNRRKYRGTLLDGLQVLKSASKRFDKEAVEAHLVCQKRKMEAARLKVRGKTTADFKNHVRAYSEVADAELERHGWPTGVSPERWKMIYPGQRYTDEFLRHRQLRKAYLNDLRCYAAIIRQRPRHVRGPIWTYDTAWRVQDISGRVSEQGGALQSCSREMKAAAFARLEDEGTLYNYDITSSQLQDVIDATKPVAAIDTGALCQRYLAVSKQENADALGISRDTYKRLLYMTTYVGSWKETLQKAVRTAYKCLPEAVRTMRRAAWTEDDVDADAVYAQASEHFQPLHEAVRKLADYLLSDYWKANKYNAGGYMMRNACGQPFRKSDYVKSDAGSTGTESTVHSDVDDTTMHRTPTDRNPTYKTHAIRSQVLAWYLQGNEADKMHRLAARCAGSGIRVEGNEHDGIITAQPIPQSIQQAVMPGSALEIKRFSDYVSEEERPTDEELQKLRDDLNKQHEERSETN